MCHPPWKFQGQKPRLMKIQYDFSGSPLKVPFLPLETLDKTKLYSWKFCKTVLHPLITPGNCTSFSVDP